MQADFFAPDRPPLVVAYGMGVDSTALLVGLRNQGVRPDAILFADTGAEKQATYDFEAPLQDWLKREGFPPVVTVRYVPQDFKNWPPYYTLEDNCLTNGTLPGISFGPASCSVKWKQAPQHKWAQQWAPAREAWSAGLKVAKLIGFDASPADRRRTYVPEDERRYTYGYPLQDWGWDRAECQRQIAAAGLPVPPKSSCFFCCAMKPPEVQALSPDEHRRIVVLEARAQPRLRTTEGLWRTTVKGTRGGTPRPGSMTRFIVEQGLLPPDEVAELQARTPTEIVSYQTAFAEGRTPTVPDYRHA
jgi:hypothetical protein